MRKVNSNTYDNGDVSAIGGNSVKFTRDKLVAKSGWFLVLATAVLPIAGRCKHDITTSATNQTVEKIRVIYEEQKPQTTREIAIDSGTSLTQADEGKYFDLKDAEKVDGTTASALDGQLQLVKFISTAKGIFKIVNKEEDLTSWASWASWTSWTS